MDDFTSTGHYDCYLRQPVLEPESMNTERRKCFPIIRVVSDDARGCE